MFANTFTMEGVGAGAVPLRFVICACQRNIPRVSALQSFYAVCFAHMTPNRSILFRNVGQHRRQRRGPQTSALKRTALILIAPS
jgi:hypothetical protein